MQGKTVLYQEKNVLVVRLIKSSRYINETFRKAAKSISVKEEESLECSLNYRKAKYKKTKWRPKARLLKRSPRRAIKSNQYFQTVCYRGEVASSLIMR